MLAKLQDSLAAAAESDWGSSQSCSLAELMSLCLVSLAYVCELGLSKDPAGLAQMSSHLAAPLTEAVMKVCWGCEPLPQQLKMPSGLRWHCWGLRPVLQSAPRQTTLPYQLATTSCPENTQGCGTLHFRDWLSSHIIPEC